MEKKEKIKKSRENYLKQAHARIKDIRGMKADINRRKKNASRDIQKELDDWTINMKNYINLANVEIEMIENSDEFLWAERRQRVDEAIGKAEREMETGYEILERPKGISA